jgi:hypothetical protein
MIKTCGGAEMLTPEQDRADREAQLRRVRAAAASCTFAKLTRDEILAAVDAGINEATPRRPRRGGLLHRHDLDATPRPAAPGSAKEELIRYLNSVGA